MYTPTEDSAEELKTAVCGSSEEMFARTPKKRPPNCDGNFNARVGTDVEACRIVIGRAKTAKNC